MQSQSWVFTKNIIFLGYWNLAIMCVCATTDDFVSLCLLSARRQVGLIDGSDAREFFSLFILIKTLTNNFHERRTKCSNGFKQRRLS